MTVYPTDLDSEIIRCSLDPDYRPYRISFSRYHPSGDHEHVVLAHPGLLKDFHMMPTIAERFTSSVGHTFPTRIPLRILTSEGSVRPTFCSLELPQFGPGDYPLTFGHSLLGIDRKIL